MPPPDTAEPREERAFDYARTVALSDGVFAIALTLLVLNFSLPHLASGHEGDLASRLFDRTAELWSYAISFAVVAFLPYPTRVLGAYGDQPAAVAFYAVTVALVSFMAGLMRVHGLRAGLVSAAGRRELERREHWAVAPAVFLLSIPIAFASTTAALLSWLLLLVLPRLFMR